MTRKRGHLIAGLILIVLVLAGLMWQNWLSVYQIMELLVSLMGVAIAYSLYRVASSSLQAAKKDRELKLLNAKLQKAYYPIFEIIRKAKFDSSRSASPSQTVLYDQEKRDIENIMRKYGYYLEPKLEAWIRVRIVDSPSDKHVFNGSEMYEIYDTLLERTEELRSKLEKLVKD